MDPDPKKGSGKPWFESCLAPSIDPKPDLNEKSSGPEQPWTLV